MQIILATSQDLQRLQTIPNTDRDAKTEAIYGAGAALPRAVPFKHSSHYLAFMLAYLEDEDLLPEKDWAMSDSLFGVRGRLTDVISRGGVDLEKLDPARFDVLELRREFHAGGPLDDPTAGDALLDAIRVLRVNFQELDDDGALVIAF
jgi:hypothetical protein